MPRAISAHLAPSQSFDPVESSSLSPVVCGIFQWPLPLWSKKLHLNEVKVYFLRNQWQRPLTVPPSHPTLVYGSTGCAGRLVIFVRGIATEYEHTRGLGRGRVLGHDGVVAVARILKSNNFKKLYKGFPSRKPLLLVFNHNWWIIGSLHISWPNKAYLNGLCH